MLVDDHGVVRAGLAAVLDSAPDLTVVGEAADGAQAVELISSVEPDVVLMDLSMPVLDGIATTAELRTRAPQTRVVVLSSFGESAKVRDAMAAGAVGYVLKDCTAEELLAAVRAAAQGYNPLDPRVAGALLPSAADGPAPVRLSHRETQVLRLAAQGLANKQIARSLGIAEHTVKVHLGNVFRRVGVTDRTSAAMWARENLPES